MRILITITITIIMAFGILGCSSTFKSKNRNDGVGGISMPSRSVAISDIVNRGRLSSGFGYRQDPFNASKVQYHYGIDIAAPVGSPIRSAMDGQVVFSGRKGGYGLIVKIISGQEITKYAHCSYLLVKEGDYVYRGDVIALVGSTGRATGPHVHFEIVSSGRNQEPLAWLSNMNINTSRSTQLASNNNNTSNTKTSKETKQNSNTSIAVKQNKSVAASGKQTNSNIINQSEYSKTVKKNTNATNSQNEDQYQLARTMKSKESISEATELYVPSKTVSNKNALNETRQKTNSTNDLRINDGALSSSAGMIRVSTRILNPHETCEMIISIDAHIKHKNSIDCGGQHHLSMDASMPVMSGRRIVRMETKTCNMSGVCEKRDVQNIIDIAPNIQTQVAYVANF